MSPRRPPLACRICTGPKPAGRGRKLCDPCALTQVDSKGQRLRPTHRAAELRRRYGMTPGQYDALLAEQGGVCAICRRPCNSGQALAVDHDHTTGQIRGLLCKMCNGTLHFVENGEWMGRALGYLGRCTPILAGDTGQAAS